MTGGREGRDRVLERIQGAQGRRDPVPAELETTDEDRAVSLFQIRFVQGILELWLFGRLVARVKGLQES